MISIREGPTACFCLYWSQQGGGAKSGVSTPITVETGGASRTEMLPEAVRPIQQNVFLSASSGPHRKKTKYAESSLCCRFKTGEKTSDGGPCKQCRMTELKPLKLRQ